jgi:arylsulfatase A-like enzyme/Flp pilus assembly protein TadD
MPSSRSSVLPALLLLAAAACGGGREGAVAPEPAQATAAGPAGARERAAPPELPAGPVDDLLLVTIDTLRWDAVGFLSERSGVTPTLDRLAASGVVFAFAHAHNVVTLPSHANILTGRLPYQHGVRDNQGFRLPESVPTLAQTLRAAGFATAAVVAAYPLDARFGLDRGFDLYDDRIAGRGGTLDRPLERPGTEVVERGLAWWREHAGRRRFLWVHLFEPHAPYEPPEPWASRFPGEPYLGEVATADAALAPLLEEVTAAGASTMVAVTSDHGEALGDHGEVSHGLFAYEATLRIPLLLWAPGLEPARPAVPARHVDLVPTLLAAAAVALPEGLAGRALVGMPASSRPTVTYFESLTPTLDRGWAPLRGVLLDREKYVDLPIPELYDLVADPGELENLLPASGERARQAAAQLPPESVWPPRRGEVPAEVERALRSLGYLGGSAAGKTEFGPEDDPKRLVDLDRKVHRLIDLYHRGRLDEAAALGREVLARRPDMGAAAYYLAQTELEAGRPAEALQVMEAAYRNGSATPALVRQLGLTLSRVGRFEAALEVLRRAAESGDPEDLNALGLVLSESGDQEAAQDALRQVFATDERNATAWQNLALVALRRADWAEASARAERALELDGGLAPAWSYLGSARFNQGEAAEALAAWKRAVELDPDDYDALYNIGLVAPGLGDPGTARTALERFLREAPRDRYAADLDEVRRRLEDLPD